MIANRHNEALTASLPALDQFCDWLLSVPGTDREKLEQGRGTVAILRSLGMDDKGCIAALLHCVDNPEVPDQQELASFCDDESLALYRGVTRLAQLSAFSRPEDERVDTEANEDNLRKMLITTAISVVHKW